MDRFKRCTTKILILIVCMFLSCQLVSCNFKPIGNIQFSKSNLLLELDLKYQTVIDAFHELNKLSILQLNLTLLCRHPMTNRDNTEENENRNNYYKAMLNPTKKEIDSIQTKLDMFSKAFNLNQIDSSFPSSAAAASLEAIQVDDVVKRGQIIPVAPSDNQSNVGGGMEGFVGDKTEVRFKRDSDDISPKIPTLKSFNNELLYSLTNKDDIPIKVLKLDDGRYINYFADLDSAVGAYETIIQKMHGKNLGATEDFNDICDSITNTVEVSIQSLTSALNIFSKQMESFISGKIPYDFLVQDAFDQIEENSRLKHSPLATKDYLSFLQLPYEIFKKDEKLMLNIICPLEDESFVLSRFDSNYPPIVIDKNAYEIKISPEKEYFAEGSGSDFATLDQKDLDQCIKVFNNYYCGNSIIYKNIFSIPDKCVSSLYNKKKQSILRDCNIKIRKTDFTLQKIDNNLYYIYSKNPITIKTNLADNSVKERTLTGSDLLKFNNLIDSFHSSTFQIHRDQTTQNQIDYEEESGPNMKGIIAPIGAYQFNDIDLDYLTTKYGNFFSPKEEFQKSYLERHLVHWMYYVQFFAASLAISIVLIILRCISSCIEGVRQAVFEYNPFDCFRRDHMDEDEYDFPRMGYGMQKSAQMYMPEEAFEQQQEAIANAPEDNTPVPAYHP